LAPTLKNLLVQDQNKEKVERDQITIFTAKEEAGAAAIAYVIEHLAI